MNSGAFGMIAPIRKAPNSKWMPSHSVASAEASTSTTITASKLSLRRSRLRNSRSNAGSMRRTTNTMIKTYANEPAIVTQAGLAACVTRTSTTM